jgi:hypothetical protein
MTSVATEKPSTLPNASLAPATKPLRLLNQFISVVLAARMTPPMPNILRPVNGKYITHTLLHSARAASDVQNAAEYTESIALPPCLSTRDPRRDCATAPVLVEKEYTSLISVRVLFVSAIMSLRKMAMAALVPGKMKSVPKAQIQNGTHP